MEYNLRNMTPEQRENLKADIETLVQERHTYDKVTMQDIDTLCRINGLDNDYAYRIIVMVQNAFKKKGLQEGTAHPMEGKIFSEKELQDLYDNQDNLTKAEERVLDAAMWVRARMANFHGYTDRWYNVGVKDQKIYYWDLDGEKHLIPSYERGATLPMDEASIISKTGSDGETSFEAVPDDMARQLNGITTTDIKGNKTTVKDTGKKTLGEAEDFGKATLNQQDILNLAKDLDVCTKEALRATGNEVAYTQQFFNKGKATITIKVFFQENADNPGKPESQEFKYVLAKGKVVLDKGKGTVTNISAIQTQSGTANINRDLAINSIKNSISKEENIATGEAGTSEPNSDIKDKPMLENFSKAVEAYRKNKSKETIKELFRSAREFPGDDIQHKFQNAVQLYKGQGCQNPDPEKCCSDGQCMSDCEIKLSESLFIRLLEFAKEDAKDDVDLHTVAENLSRICSEDRCASIEDYEDIVGDSEQDNPGEDVPEEETEQPEQLQESEPDERDWDESWRVEDPDPGEIIFYYDPETKDFWDEDKFSPEPGKEYITGVITCAEVGLEDQSFSHAFGTEYIYEPVCTEVDIRIDGMEKDGDYYDANEDIAEAENLLSKEDWENIRKWGIELMTNKM